MTLIPILRNLIAGATKGVWYDHRAALMSPNGQVAIFNHAVKQGRKNCAYVAAACPENMARILDALDAAEDVLLKVLPMVKDVSDTDLGHLVMDDDHNYAEDIVNKALTKIKALKESK